MRQFRAMAIAAESHSSRFVRVACRAASAATAIVSLLGSGAAEAREPLLVPRLTGEIRFDGRVDEPAWQAIPPIALTMFTPTAGAVPSEQTEIRLVHDDEYIYVSGRFMVRSAESIRATSLVRDQLGGTEDHFMVILDTYNDSQSAMVFSVNPSGAISDMAVDGDGQSVNSSWNTYWEAATSRDASGWYVEYRIPFSSLHFQVKDGHTTMGLILHRMIASHNELDTFPPLSPDFANAPFRSSIAEKVVLSGLRGHTPVYITPYVMGGLSSVSTLNAAGTAFGRDVLHSREAGLDLKYGVTSNLVLDFTVNTDFAQVEADDQQVNLTRFSLLFPEKRQFFQERSGFFQLATGGPGDPSLLFNSRQIGLTDDGRPLRIYGGVRLAGRVGQWDVGALSMQTETVTGHGSENVSVLRVRHEVLNDASYVGGLVTSRLGGPNGRNLAYAADVVLRPFGNDFLTGQWAQSFDSGETAAGDSGMARLEWTRRSARGLQYQGGAKWAGRDYRAGLGFQPRTDFNTFYGSGGYGLYPVGASAFQSITPTILGYVFNRNSDKTLESGYVQADVTGVTRSGLTVSVRGSRSLERLDAPLVFSKDAIVPAGRHEFNQARVSLTPGPTTRLGLGVTAAVGQLYDGTQLNFDVAPAWNPSAHLQLSVEYNINRLRFASRSQHFDADLARLRIQYALDRHLSITGFVQYNRAAADVVGNLRFRWHFQEGHDLWLVYNDQLNTDRAAGTPALAGLLLPFSQEHSLLAKYTYTFTH